MLKLDKLLPGELDDDIDPRDYGFDVIADEPPSEQEQLDGMIELYVQARERTGVTSPKMERLLRESGVAPAEGPVDEAHPELGAAGDGA